MSFICLCLIESWFTISLWLDFFAVTRVSRASISKWHTHTTTLTPTRTQLHTHSHTLTAHTESQASKQDSVPGVSASASLIRDDDQVIEEMTPEVDPEEDSSHYMAILIESLSILGRVQDSLDVRSFLTYVYSSVRWSTSPQIPTVIYLVVYCLCGILYCLYVSTIRVWIRGSSLHMHYSCPQASSYRVGDPGNCNSFL